MRSRLAFSLLLTLLAVATAFPQGYKLTGAINVGGKGGWDYLTADSENRRLYVSHGGEVEVIDLDTRKIVGTIPGLNRIHGIFVANDLGVGFITDGGSNEVVMFDLKDMAIKNKIKAGANPDGAVYDSVSQRLFVFNGWSANATVIDAKTGSVAGTIKLGGKPEFPVSDGKGSVYDNLEDKSEIVRIDAKTMAVTAHWPVAPCESPSGLAMDRESRRLFAVCDNKMMAVVDADSGKVIATPAVGEGPDAASFDPGAKLAFSSNGESGTVTVVHEEGDDNFNVVQTIQTERGARTMTLDEKTHKLYLPTAKFGAPPEPTAAAPHPRPAILPGSFKILVVSK